MSVGNLTQFLKLINKRREQKKINEEIESLKESAVRKMDISRTKNVVLRSKLKEWKSLAFETKKERGKFCLEFKTKKGNTLILLHTKNIEKLLTSLLNWDAKLIAYELAQKGIK